MHQLVSEGLWELIEDLASKATIRRAAIAYVSIDSPLNFGEGDLLITDASDASIKAGHTSARVLGRALKSGAHLFSLPNLHAKVMVLDRHAVIGSANLSESSRSHLTEAALVTEHPTTLSQTRAFLEELVAHSEPIDRAFMKRISQLDVRRTRGARHKAARVVVRRSSVWLVGLHQLDDRRYVHEHELVEEGYEQADEHLTMEDSEAGWIRFPLSNTSKFRREAQRGDVVIQIWRPAGRKTPSAVYKHAPILHRQDEPACTRFFIEEFEDAQETAVRWKRFLNLAEGIGLTRLGPNSTRLLSDEHANALHALWPS